MEVNLPDTSSVIAQQDVLRSHKQANMKCVPFLLAWYNSNVQPDRSQHCIESPSLFQHWPQRTSCMSCHVPLQLCYLLPLILPFDGTRTLSPHLCTSLLKSNLIPMSGTSQNGHKLHSSQPVCSTRLTVYLRQDNKAYHHAHGGL